VSASSFGAPTVPPSVDCDWEEGKIYAPQSALRGVLVVKTKEECCAACRSAPWCKGGSFTNYSDFEQQHQRDFNCGLLSELALVQQSPTWDMYASDITCLPKNGTTAPTSSPTVASPTSLPTAVPAGAPANDTDSTSAHRLRARQDAPYGAEERNAASPPSGGFRGARAWRERKLNAHPPQTHLRNPT
jgi:hypothetical protein